MTKTAVAVFICLLIYIARGYHGMPGESAVAAIICMQPYTSDSKWTAVHRVISTVLGGIWGLLFLLLMQALPGISSHMVTVYLIMSAGVLLALYSCVALNIAPSAALAAIVYICIIISYPDVDEPLIQTFDRILDTTIGVCVAVAVNGIHLAVIKHPEKIFFLQLKDIAADRYTQLPSRVLIDLNRLYDAGAHICLETHWAPAFMITQMSAVRINMPIIVMDGAALYDMKENLYYEIMAIPQEDAALLRKALLEQISCVCIFAIRSSTMMIFHDGPMSEAEQWDFDLMRKTPYRNYMDGMYAQEDKVVAIRILVRNEDADEAYEKVAGLPEISGRFCVRRYVMAVDAGWTGIYCYRYGVSVEQMEKRMTEYLTLEHNGTAPVAIHVAPPDGKACDPETGAVKLLNRISDEYMQRGFR